MELACRCGRVRLALRGGPILAAECCCTSCREAAARMAALPGAPPVLTGYGATPFVLWRKDRLRIEGAGHLAAFRLTPASPTRRVLATCCNTPMFLEFTKGHWLSLYGGLWPEGTRPRPLLRTMTGDLPDRSVLPDDIPNPRSHTAGFMARLLWAWVKMGFRSPKIAIEREIEV